MSNLRPNLRFRKFWTCASTRWRDEERAASHIEAQGFEFYLPRFSSVGVARSGRKFFKRELLFPGYIFILIKKGWETLIRTKGILSLFLIDEMPRRMHDSEVNSLKNREDERGLVRLRPPLVQGQRVKFASGSYRGLSGIVDGTPAYERCRVLVQMLGREVAGEFDERVLIAA
jgi:transcription antitermination factor NusG